MASQPEEQIAPRRAGLAADSGNEAVVPSVAELSACLAAMGSNEVLDMPFARMCDGVADPDTRELFEHLASDHRGYNLRSVLRFDELDPWVARTCTERETQLIRAQLQCWLEQTAAHDPEPARDWRKPVSPEALALLSVRLLELLSLCAGAGEPLPRFSQLQPLRLDVAQARVSAELCSDARQRSQTRFGVFACELQLQGYEHAPLTGRCSCEPPAAPSYRCCHMRALCVRLLDAIHGPDSTLRRELLRVGATPSWVRFFNALGPPLADAAADGAAQPTRRLTWKLRLDADGHVRVAPALQKRVRDNWSSGARSALDQVPEELCDATDNLVLGLLRSNELRADGEHLCNLALLRVLIGHARLQDAQTQAPLALEEVRIELGMHAVTSGVVPHARLAGRPLTLSGAARADHVAREAGNGRWLFAPLPAALARFVAGVTSAPTVLPPESHAQLRQRLRELQPYAALALPPQLTGPSEAAEHRLLLRLANGAGEGVLRAELHARPIHGGPLFLPGQGPSEVLGERDGRHAYVLRDLAQEKAQAAELSHALHLDLAHEEAPYRFRLDELDASLALLERAARAHDQVEIEWLTGQRPLRLLSCVQRRNLKLKVGNAQRWYEASGHAELPSGQHVPLIALLDAARTGQRYVRVAADSYVTMHEELRTLLEGAADLVYSEPDKLKLAANVLPKLFALAEPARIERAPEIDGLLARMQRAPELPITLPEHLHALLRPYQRDGVTFLLRLASWASGACLADEMGLGKTLQALCALSARSALGPALVIAPTSVGHAWCAEAARFTPELQVALYRGPERARLLHDLSAGQVLVTSYELVQRDRAALAQIPFATLVLDEAHMVKNATTERARAVAALSAQFRIGLTGTPLENHLGELWSLMAQLNPGVLGSWHQFRARFGVPIERYGNEQRMAALRKLVSPFLLRREKREVAPELPARIEVTQLVSLSASEQTLYDAAVRDLRARIADPSDEIDRIEMLAEITRLRQLACHPRLVLADWPQSGSKLRYLEESLAELLPRGHRALLFSQFVGHLQLVRSALAARGHACLYLDGSTPAGQRAELVQRWQSGQDALFLISLKAGGTGLHLPGADYVFHLDPWWNPAAEDQASDRAHRIGQHRPVTIVRLLAQGTVEEQVAALHTEKRELALSLLQETGARAWDTRELAAYLGLT